MSGEANFETVFGLGRTGGPEGAGRASGESWQLHAQTRYRMRTLIDDVVRTIVLPRLLAAHAAEGGPPGSLFGDPDINALASRACAPDFDAAEALAAALRDGRATRHDLLLNLIAPAAQRAQELWRTEALSLADMTLAMGRLQSLLRHPAIPGAPPPRACGGTALIAPAPGELHGFGAALLADVFRCARWRACCVMPPAPEEIISAVHNQPVDVVALSVSLDANPVALAALIKRVRRSSANPRVRVVTAGRPAPECAGAWRRVKADAAAADAHLALVAASGFLRTLSR